MKLDRTNLAYDMEIGNEKQIASRVRHARGVTDRRDWLEPGTGLRTPRQVQRSERNEHWLFYQGQLKKGAASISDDRTS